MPLSHADRTTLAVPLKNILILLVIVLSVGGLFSLGTGRTAAGIASLAGAIACGAAYALLSKDRVSHAASLGFFALGGVVGALLWFGHGTRDYALACVPAVMFLGCVFMAPLAYWLLALAMLAGVSLVGIAEFSGWRAPLADAAPDVRNLIELWLIVGGSAIGGRLLLAAVQDSFSRSDRLSGELAQSVDRMQKVFKSSQNAVVVTNLEDGRYLDVNDAYLAMFGFDRESVIGKTSLELGIWIDVNERQRMKQRLREAKSIRDFEARLRKCNGEVMEVVLAAELMKVDGTDCLVISVLDDTARRNAERRAEYLSTRDALTGLPNRLLALDRLRHALEKQKRTGGCIGILHIDLDRFKSINDLSGHAVGDAVLREAALRLDAVRRSGDTLARIGADEFLLVADSLSQRSQTDQLAERAIASFEWPFLLDGKEFKMSASVGISTGPDDSADAETLLQFAETALHKAKELGRKRYVAFEAAMSHQVRDRAMMESNLRHSLSSDGLRLAYQPKFDMRTGQLCGLEALARWHHPAMGEVAPTHFVAVAEETELIDTLGDWVLESVCRQLAAWRMAGLPMVPVAINLSARQIEASLPERVAAATLRHQISPALIEFEVTETVLIARPEAARRVFARMAANGNRIVLDDFGVGYSALSYVKLLHLTGIKVDRSFVAEIVANRHDRAIVAAIVGLAHGLGFRVVAEGVEQAAQLAMLRELGCDEVQGFHLCEPIAAAEIAERYLVPLAPQQAATG